MSEMFVYWIDSTNEPTCSFQVKKRGGGRNRMKGPGTDDDKCHTLNHMFLLKLSDRPKEDLWVCGIFVFFLRLRHGCALAQSAPIQTQLACLREIHLPSLGMPKWLWRCNSLILGSEQCSSYCYGKSMWLSWRAASTGLLLRSCATRL